MTATPDVDVVQDDPVSSPLQLRVDFGAHLEAHYQRLVAQLYAITLDPREAHDAVQDAYSRAWREWATVSRSEDPTAWVRRVAVRSTIRSWRRVAAKVGIGRPQPVGDSVDPRTGALLDALRRLPPAERRCVVLAHMAGASPGEIAAIEQVSRGTVQARLARARMVVTEGMADVLPEVLGADVPLDADPYDRAASYDGATGAAYDGATGVAHDSATGVAHDSATGVAHDSDLYGVYDDKGEYR